MSADKLGRYMTSNAFLARANAAVSKAVRQLEERGVAPAYVQRSLSEPPKTAASGRDASAPEKE